MLRRFSRSLSHLTDGKMSQASGGHEDNPRGPNVSSPGQTSISEFLNSTIPPPTSAGYHDFDRYNNTTDDHSDEHEAAEAPEVPRSRSGSARHSYMSARDLPLEPDFGDMDDSYIPDDRVHSYRRPDSSQSEPYYSAGNNVERPVSPETVHYQGGGSTRSPSDARKSVMSKSSHGPSSISSFAPANSVLAPLQTKGAGNNDGLEPLAEEEIDPASFDLVVPANAPTQYSLEERSELLFSKEHLKVIFEDPTLLQRFTTFLCAAHPSSVPVLVYYLDALKAIRALAYVNSITKSLKPLKDSDASPDPIQQTVNDDLQAKADQAFELLRREDLPAYITHTWVRIVSVTIKRRIADTLPVHLRDLSEGLAEVFCLTDPSRPDCPIIFASEEFHRTTQYGMNYVLGRNCRFLQGPKTEPASIRRLKEMVLAGKEHCETLLNYRRDGSPFMNLLMVSPLFDSRGNVRYYIGAQVDVSGLARECAGLESLERLVQQQEAREAEQDGRFDASKARPNQGEAPPTAEEKDEFRNLAEMFNLTELKAVREHGGSLHRTRQTTQGGVDGDDANLTNWNKPRLLIRDDASMARRDSDPIMTLPSTTGGKLGGVYEHYLLVRPYPSLRILFASPTMRVPGMLQSSFMDRIGGSRQVRDALTQAFADGNGVTAKVRWISDRQKRNSRSINKDEGTTSAAPITAGKGRWIHCTPLLGGNGAVGVWMVVLVEDEIDSGPRRGRDAPPVSRHIGQASLGGTPIPNEFDRQSLLSAAGISTTGPAAAGAGSGSTSHYRPDSRQQTSASSQRRHRDGRETPDIDDLSLAGASFLDNQIAAASSYSTASGQQPSQGDLRQHYTSKRRLQQQQGGAAPSTAGSSIHQPQHGRSAAIDIAAMGGQFRGATQSRLKAALPPAPQGVITHEGISTRSSSAYVR